MSAAYSYDMQKIVTSGIDLTIKVWNATNFTLIHEFTGFIIMLQFWKKNFY